MNALHTRGPDCETCEGFCHYAGSVADALSALAALRELVAVKQEAEEISRLKQRRATNRWTPEGIAEYKRVKALHEAWKVRDFRAWNVARAVIQRSAA